MVVTAQPTVYAEILTPAADRKEGGQVDMRCTATNLETDHVVEWRTDDPYTTLRWGETTYQNVNGRFIFDTSGVNTQTVVQDFTITNVQRADTDEYVCNVIYPIPTGGNTIVATSNVTLSVLYFPNASFPMCSPAGPITVDAGTEFYMRCSSESSHGTVTMTINPTIQTSRSTNWTSVINDDSDTVVRTLDLTVDGADNGVAFECFISSMYFAGMKRTCQIGPITVRNSVTIPTTEPTTSSTSTLSTAGSTRPSTGNPTPTTENEVTSTSSTVSSPSSPGAAPSSTPWIVAFIVVLILAVTFFVIIIILILRDVRKNRLIKRPTSEKEPQVTQPDPYMELQPTEDKNRVYMEPTTTKETIPNQDTYYQPVEVENGSPEYDYARPEGSTNTYYEAVRVPAEKQYQNITN
ncbi:mucin-5AC-like [Asterias rubens]|uniref:mucin-5AC-like n=1 Tax=Asterias rubens TaxID=7604 RepID=UPI00145595BC|nr:mucin-5AC-like [Asterias rubens]